MKTTVDNLEERQGQLGELVVLAEQVLEALQHAESCETPLDFDANVDEAISLAKTFLADAAELRG